MDIIRNLDLGRFAPLITPLVDELLLLDLRSCSESDIHALGVQLCRAQELIAEERQASKTYLEEVELVPLINAVEAHRPGAIPPDWNDLARLHRLVREERPDRVLELGSGWSTLAIAKALADNGHGSLLSFDADASWAEVNARTIPDDLKSRCEVRHGPSKVRALGPVPVLEHEGVPSEAFDFIYLDGPAHYPMVRVAADPLRLEPCLRPGTTILVDGRHENVIFLWDRLERRWSARSEGLCCIETGLKAKDLLVRHTILRLEDVPS